MRTYKSAAPTGIGSGARAWIADQVQDTAPLIEAQSRWIARHIDIDASLAPTIAHLAFAEALR